MLTDQIAALIARKLSGEATPAELRELADHFEKHPADQYFEELLRSYWNSQDDIPTEHSDEHFTFILASATEEKMKESVRGNEVPKIIQRSKNRILIKSLGIAAVIAGVLFGLWKLIPHQAVIPKHTPENEVATKKGARSKLLLPDGSQVWLNSDSKLAYPASFNDSIREVELEGEAYFDVVKNSKRPFIVHTSSIDIRVLGTAFDVKSYDEEPTIETTLIRGTIEVVKKNQPGSPRFLLHSHQKYTHNKAEDTSVTKDLKNLDANTTRPDAAKSVTVLPKNTPDTSIIETSWIYNKLAFDGEKFSDVAIKMQRWFDVKIIFKNDWVANQRLHGSVVNETIDEALQNLQEFVPFKYNKNGDEIEIDKK